MSWVAAVASVSGGLALLWLALVAVLWLAARREDAAVGLRDLLRLVPDLVVLVSRLVRDLALPRGVRVRLGLLLVYLAMPFDLIPDVIPVVGYADDAVLVALTLRSVVRRAGPEVIERHWPGSPAGLAVIAGLVRPGPS